MLLKLKLFLILALGTFTPSKCQFFYSKQEHSTLFFNNIIDIKNTQNYLILCNKQSKTPSSLFTKLESKFLIIGKDGVLLDSLVLDSNFSLNRSFIFYHNHYYFSGVLYKYYSVNNFASLLTLLKYDLNLNLIKKIVLDSLNNEYPDNIKSVQINNSLYTGYSKGAPSTNFKLYKTNLNLVKTDSTVLVGEDMFDMENYDGNLLISGSNFPQSTTNYPLQVAELDTAFNVLSRFNIDSLTYVASCGQKIGLSGYSVNLNYLGAKKYALTGSDLVATCGTAAPINYKFKTITSIIKNNKRVQSTIITGLPGMDQFHTANSTICSFRNGRVYSTALVTNFPSVNMPDTNSLTQMQVQCIDSVGTLKWVKYFGGDSFYFPTCTYATADSGAIVCGVHYDKLEPKVKNVAEAFVMKIDKNGNEVFVGLQENGKINTHYHKIYPNPSQKEIHIRVPLQDIYEIRIYNLSGKEELLIPDCKNPTTINVSGLNPGTYLYRIKTATNIISGRLIKE